MKRAAIVQGCVSDLGSYARFAGRAVDADASRNISGLKVDKNQTLCLRASKTLPLVTSSRASFSARG